MNHCALAATPLGACLAIERGSLTTQASSKSIPISNGVRSMATFIRQGGRRLASWLFGGLLAILAGAVDAGTVDQRHAPRRRTHYFDLPRQVLAEDLPRRAERPLNTEERAAEATARAAVIESAAMVDCLAWLDAYFAVQVEYDDDQIAAFQRRLERMSSDQLLVFLRKFERQRAQLRQAARQDSAATQYWAGTQSGDVAAGRRREAGRDCSAGGGEPPVLCWPWPGQRPAR